MAKMPENEYAEIQVVRKTLEEVVKRKEGASTEETPGMHASSQHYLSDQKIPEELCKGNDEGQKGTPAGVFGRRFQAQQNKCDVECSSLTVEPATSVSEGDYSSLTVLEPAGGEEGRYKKDQFHFYTLLARFKGHTIRMKGSVIWILMVVFGTVLSLRMCYLLYNMFLPWRDHSFLYDEDDIGEEHADNLSMPSTALQEALGPTDSPYTEESVVETGTDCFTVPVTSPPYLPHHLRG